MMYVLLIYLENAASPLGENEFLSESAFVSPVC